MGFELVVAVFFDLRGLEEDGSSIWMPHAALFHEVLFETNRDCELYKQENGEEVAEHMKDAFRDHWMRVLKPDRRDVRFTTDVGCFEIVS